MASIQGGSVFSSNTYAELSFAEQAAARKALTGLGVDNLLTGNGSDTFAGGAVTSGSFVAAFSSDTVGGGNLFNAFSDSSVPMSADPFSIVGPTAEGVAADAATAAGGYVVTFGDQTTVNLIGVNSPGSGTQ